MPTGHFTLTFTPCNRDITADFTLAQEFIQETCWAGARIEVQVWLPGCLDC